MSTTRHARRHFLKLAAASAGTAFAAGCASTATQTKTTAGGTSAPNAGRRARGPARNIIFLVADGMSMGTLTLADRMRRQTNGQPSHWASMWSDPRVKRHLMMTHSADSMVTDSAAGGSAWGSGVHINNGSINITPTGAEPEPILLSAKRAGRATGLVTTTRITHATPASFAANVPSRDMEAIIADQLLERPIDLMLGGGARNFSDELLATHPGVRTVTTKAQLASSRGSLDNNGRLLGLFSQSHMDYEVDRRSDRASTQPSIAEMTRFALAELDGRDNGFVLQVEGGRVDHAAHGNDAAALVHDQLAFDDAIAEAWRFAKDRDDTIIILTTDHGNANPGLTLYKEPGNAGFDRLFNARHSFQWIEDQAETAATPVQRVEIMPLLIKQATGIDLTDADRAWLYRRIVDQERCDGFLPNNRESSVLGAVLANHYGVSFVSPNHTADDVELTLFTPGIGAAEDLGIIVDNVELHPLMLAAMGVRA
jgi:alkaline phosphatase